MKINFNGFTETFDSDRLTVQDLLDLSEENDPAVIVEINGRFIHRKHFTTTFLNEDDRVEFIHPSFGG
ncbi:MAG: sulfur carrier protein ThiS [Syntrophaceae bacterium]|nr:sulfur carrier protein ThiS [Syntrophaceae bacterium]